jgi:hypothetical protein
MKIKVLLSSFLLILAISVAPAMAQVPGGTPTFDAPADYDGDKKTDYGIFRNSGGISGTLTWWVKLNTAANAYKIGDHGKGNDSPVIGDFDGDGKDDFAVYHQSSTRELNGFSVIRSLDNTVVFFPFGQPSDDPLVVADYTGDGKDDPAIYRAGNTATDVSTFWYLASSGPVVGKQVPIAWGGGGDQAVPGDYTGDGIADYAVYRSVGGKAQFYIKPGTGTIDSPNFTPRYVTFGTFTDYFVPGDYDGDGTTDIAQAQDRGGVKVWIVRPSSGGPETYRSWGFASDYEVQGDYDGDGKTDVAIWRPTAPATFWIVPSTPGSSPYTVQWGLPSDTPIAYDVH